MGDGSWVSVYPYLTDCFMYMRCIPTPCFRLPPMLITELRTRLKKVRDSIIEKGVRTLSSAIVLTARSPMGRTALIHLQT